MSESSSFHSLFTGERVEKSWCLLLLFLVLITKFILIASRFRSSILINPLPCLYLNAHFHKFTSFRNFEALEGSFTQILWAFMHTTYAFWFFLEGYLRGWLWRIPNGWAWDCCFSWIFLWKLDFRMRNIFSALKNSVFSSTSHHNFSTIVRIF